MKLPVFGQFMGVNLNGFTRLLLNKIRAKRQSVMHFHDLTLRPTASVFFFYYVSINYKDMTLMNKKIEIKSSVGQVVSNMTVTIDGVCISVIPVQTAAKRMGYSIRHVQNLCDFGVLIAIKISGLWFIHELEIEVYRQNARHKSGV